MPSLNSHRKLVKSVLTAFGMKRCHALTFAGHRAVYVLGGLQAAKETLESLLSKLNEPPTKNAIAKVANDMSKGLAVLRQMVKQISSMDLEFVETRLCVREAHCWATSTEDQRKEFLSAWAGMWRNMVQKVSNIDASRSHRSQEDWEDFAASESKKLYKLNVKTLAQTLAASVPDLIAQLNGQGTLPDGFPSELVDLLPSDSSPTQESRPQESKEETENEKIESSLKTVKKDLLVRGLVALHTQEAKCQEAANCELWENQVKNAISIDAGDIVGLADGQTGEGPGICDNTWLPFPSADAKVSKHWEAHQAASLATWAILCAYTKSPLPAGIEVENAESFRDQGLTYAGILKKKVTMRRKVEDDGLGPTSDLRWNEAVAALRMCFAGRCVVVPRGQPVSAFKIKVRIPSTFFENLGYDAYMIPITKQLSPEMSLKSPLLCPAWLVKGKSKGTNMIFDQVDVKVRLSRGSLIDLGLPALRLIRPEELVIANVKTPGSSKGEDLLWAGFDLSRPFTHIEVSEGAAKNEAKVAKDQRRKQRAEAFEEVFDGDGDEVTPADGQLLV
ncbi:unnamed protein product, partial [Durusdinium trenchii]